MDHISDKVSCLLYSSELHWSEETIAISNAVIHYHSFLQLPALYLQDSCAVLDLLFCNEDMLVVSS